MQWNGQAWRRLGDWKFRGRPLGIGMMAAVIGLTGCFSPSPAERRARDRFEVWGERSAYGEPTESPSKPGGRPMPRAAQGLPEDPSVQDYVDFAIAHHPSLKAAFQRWRAALERVPQARALKDPNLNYTYFVEKSMNRQTVTLSQTFPWYDKLRARRDRAAEEALAAEQRFEERRLEVVAEVRQAYAEYAYLAAALDVMRENRRIREDLRDAAEARFQSGEVPYADVVRAEVAVDAIADEIASLEGRRGALTGRLNAALGRSADKPLPWPPGLDQPPVKIDEAQLLARLPETNPELRALRHEIESRRQNLRLARQNWIPDFTLGVGYHDMLPEDLESQISVMGGINLPLWWGRLKAEREEAEADLEAATRREGDRRNRLESELRLAWYRFHDAQRRLDFYQEALIPGARENLEAAEAAYSDGEVEFESLTQAQSKLQELRLTYERTAADRYRNLAALERLVGRLSGPEPPERQEAPADPDANPPTPEGGSE